MEQGPSARLPVEGSTFAAAPPDEVDDAVEQQHGRAEHELHFAGEPLGIERGDDVMLDEAALVPCFAAAPPEPDLERREGTDEADELDCGAVERDGHVDPCDARPAER